MAAPALLAVRDARSQTLARLPALPGQPALICFLITRSGHHGGADYSAGDVVLCDDSACHGDEVVLTACGYGRPRLGHIDGLALIGDAGERCHPGRWRAAGRVVGVLREEVNGWVLRLRAGCSAVEAPSPVTTNALTQLLVARPGGYQASAPQSEQLALFEQAA